MPEPTLAVQLMQWQVADLPTAAQVVVLP